MEKSIYSERYSLFLSMLRRAREQAGLSQVVLAERLKVTQSFVSKCERGERRLDVVEFAAWCSALGMTAHEFVASFEAACIH